MATKKKRSPKKGESWLDFYTYKKRLVFSLVRAAVQVATKLKMSLDDFVEVAQMAYFEETRIRKKKTLHQVARSSGKSVRSIAYLQKRFRDDFFAPEREVALRRRVAMALDHATLDLDQLCDKFDNNPQEIEAALEDLLRQGQIIESGDGYARNPESGSFFSETDGKARVDGVNRQMDILASAVWNRLVESDDEAATGRSFVFDADPKKLHQFVERWIAELRTEATQLHQQKGDKPRYGITIAVGPVEEE